MPFAKRVVTPVRLNRKRVDKENQFDLDIVSNNSLVSTIKQLSNLAVHADSLFEELSQEFMTTAQKADKLKHRVDSLVDNVSKLNAKAVRVPEGDLDQYAKIPEHYVTNNNYKGSLFSPETRPDSVKILYSEGSENPIRIIRQCNANRTDGRTGSKLFTLTPVFQDEMYEETDADTCVKPAPVPEADRSSKNVPEPKSRPKSLPGFPEIEVRPCSPDPSVLPTPEDKVKIMSRSQPVALVPIDITGSGFDRMCEYRESVRSTSREYLEGGTRSLKRKKRRPTVSGAPGLVFNEVSTSMYNMNHLSPTTDIKMRSVSHERGERPKSAALETYAPRPLKADRSTERTKRTKDKKEKRERSYDPDESNLARSCSLRRSLKSLFKDKRSKSTDLWAEGRPESPGPPVVNLTVPLKRSRSLPRSLKSVMQSSATPFNGNRCASTEGRLDSHSNENLTQPEKTSSSLRRSRKSDTRPKIPRSVSHNSNLSYSTFVDNLDRPKSMDIGPHSFLGSGNLRQPIPVSSPVTPTSTESMASRATQESNKSHGKHVHVHIPDRPWTKPFAKVKLRVGKKEKTPGKDERQSSSGHWSASSSSARHSLESDCLRSPSSPERLSQCDKDSAVSLNIHAPERFPSETSEDTVTQQGDGDSSTLNGSSSGNESIIDVQNNFTKMSTDEWLKSVKMKKGKGISRTGTIRSTTSQSSNESVPAKGRKESRLTTKNLRAHDDVHQPLSKGMSRVGDDESSIYSIDQEGFYTSMHKDCGMHKASEQLLEEDEDNMSSGSTVSEDTETNSPKPKGHSNISKKISSFLSKRATVKRRDKKTPPPPPPRVSTISDKNNTSHNESSDSKQDSSPTELQKLAALANKMAASKALQAKKLAQKLERPRSFESDAESIYARVKLKSNISPSAIPSLCMVTPIHSDDEDADMLSYSRAWKPPSSGEFNYQKYTGSLKSSKSAPGTLTDSFTIVSPDTSSLTMSTETSSKGEQTMTDTVNMSRSSTWPRSPVHKVTSRDEAHTKVPPLLTPPESLTIQPPNCNLFYADESFKFVDSRHAIPEVKTPDSILDCGRGFDSPTNNTFKAPQESSTPLDTNTKGQYFFGTPSINSILSFNADSSDPSQATFTDTSGQAKTSDWTATWPRRKGTNFLKNIPADVSKDDSTIMLDGVLRKSDAVPKSVATKVPQKGDRAHFINCAISRRVQTPKSLPIAPVGVTQPEQLELQAAHAKLVISSPVANRASFVENPYKRSVCSPVTADDLLKFWNYSSADKWYNTLPRKNRHDVKHSLSFTSGQGLKEQQQAEVEPSINKVPKSSTMFDFVTPPVTEGDPQRPPSKPLYPSILAMKHSVNYPSKEKKSDPGTPADFGRTWYDGVDASSTVVVMNPDGTSHPTKGSSKTTFSAFLRDHSSIGMARSRRGSNASSISTNSSSSGKKSVTFASVHRASSSSLSRTSLDATSITSSQISGDMQQGSDTRSVISDDGIQVTPQKAEAPHPIYSKEPLKLFSALKRTSSAGSSDLPVCTCPLETIIGSDSEGPMNTIEDQSFDERPSSPSPVKTIPKSILANEPTAKRLKVNAAQSNNTRSPRHKLSPRSKMKHSTLFSTSFAGPSIKLDPPMEKLVTDCGKEIKPMPLITTSFVGGASTLPRDSGSEGSARARLIFPGKSDTLGKSVSRESSPAKTVTPKRPVGPPPPPPTTKNSQPKTPSVQPGTLGTVKSQPKENIKQASNIDVESEKKVLSASTNISLATSNKKGEKRTNESDVVPINSLHHASSSKLPFKNNPNSVVTSSSVSTSSSSSRSALKAPTSKYSSLPRSSSKEPSSSDSSSSSSSSSTPLSTVSTKPTPPKFVLPKLRPWNPSPISNSATSLLSRLSAGTSSKASPAAGDSQDEGPAAEGASTGSAERLQQADCPGVGAGGVPTSSTGVTSTTHREASSMPEGALPSGPRDDKTVTAVQDISTGSNTTEKAKLDKETGTGTAQHKGILNKSFGDLGEAENNLKTQQSTKTGLNCSTSSLNKWSTSLSSSSATLTVSASNLAGLSVSSSNLNSSNWSLARSTDSLASNSSTADKSRAAKIAFLNAGNEIQEQSGAVPNRFSKYSLGQKALSASRTSLASLSECGESMDKNSNSKLVKERSFSSSSTSSSSSMKSGNNIRRLSSTEKENNNNSRRSSTSSSSPVQGKFVNNVLSQLQKKGIDASITKASQTSTTGGSPQ